MSHLKNIGTFLAGYASHANHHTTKYLNEEDIVKKGYLAKRKNMKKRFFVLRRETSETEPARLEYYDSEKKFNDGCHPKKKYILKNCFNINRKTDKNNFVIALYINKDCISLVADNERDMKEWLQSLQFHKNSSVGHSETKRIDYDHVWQVEVLQRSLASTQNLTGKHWLCLTNRVLSLVRLDNPSIKKEFLLSTIKKCGFMDQFFFLRLGRYSGIGCGELYMQTEDSFIAQNIHNSVGSAMNNFGRTSSLTDSDIRKRATSDPHGEVVPVKSRERADSVPNNPKKHFTRLKLCPSLEKIHQLQELSSSSDDGMKTFLENDQHVTPDDEFSYFCTQFSNYIPMKGSKSDSAQPNASYTDDGYVPMDGSSNPDVPTSLNISHSLEALSQTLASPLNPSSVESPADSIKASSPISKGVATDEAYVSMQSPGSSFPGTHGSGSINHYIDMGPLPTFCSIDSENVRGTATTSSPIAASPSDDSCELFGNSESSSCTSGHSSDHRIHEFIGDSAHGSFTDNFISGMCGFGIDDPESFIGPRSNRTCSVGSKPEQFKKKTSAPVLDSSLVSHSWSGTPGSYFRFLVQSRNSPRENNLMEMDFSKNRSCDVIPSDDKDREKKTSRDRLWHTFTGHRHRSNSKSSGSSGSKIGPDSSWTIKDMMASENEIPGRGVEIPSIPSDKRDYLELNFSNNSRSSSSDFNKGYLSMHAPPFISSSLTSPNSEIRMDKRGPRTNSLNDNYLEMSSSLGSTGSHDGYVDMTQGGGGSSSSGLNMTSSSSSSTSINNTPLHGSRSRRASSNIYVPMASSLELVSPLEDHHEFDKEVENKKKKKNSRRRSLKEGVLKKKLDIDIGADSTESGHKSKSSGGPFTSLTNFISRSAINAKFQSMGKDTAPVPAKSLRDAISPFSSLKRSKSKEKDFSKTSLEEKIAEDTKMASHDFVSPTSSIHSFSTSVSSSLGNRNEEKILLNSLENKLRRESVRQGELSGETTYSQSSEASNLKAESAASSKNYVNMDVNISSPEILSLKCSCESSHTSKENDAPPSKSTPATSAKVPGETTVVTSKAEFLESSLQRPMCLKTLSLTEEKPNNNNNIERSRSHSGPENSNKKSCSKLVRTASASSSPVSYSPPTSPTLGSQSSMSSLSEGALSSASSTCTVLNAADRTISAAAPAPATTVVKPIFNLHDPPESS